MLDRKATKREGQDDWPGGARNCLHRQIYIDPSHRLLIHRPGAYGYPILQLSVPTF